MTGIAITDAIRKIINRQDLPLEQAENVFTAMMNGEASPAQIAAILTGLQMKGETVQEITGAARVMRANAIKINAPEGTIDTCGTGGDGKGSYNISTAVAFVVAGSGVPVAKHGNKGVSSVSGSSDVLRELGVNIAAEVSVMEKALHEVGICFMMAPQYHSAMKYIAPVRSDLGIRTIFNILGPLTNPAMAKYQLIGVYSKDLVEKLANVLAALGSEHVWVVHGEDGMDEITTTGITYVAKVSHGVVSTFSINPSDYGITIASPDDLKGGDPAHNAAAIRELLMGRGTKPYKDIVLLNSAAALVISGKAANIQEGLKLAAISIDSGMAYTKLQKLIDCSR